MAGDRFSYEELRESSIKIIEAWKKVADTRQKDLTLRPERRGRKRPGMNLRASRIQLGFAADTAIYAESIIGLLDEERAVEAIPLARVSYETALTSQWIDLLGDDAANAVANEFIRQQKALRRDVLNIDDPAFKEVVDDIPVLDDERTLSASDSQAQNFKQMTADFADGEKMYVYYRTMCAYSHAGISTVDRYFTKLPASGGTAFQYFPVQPERGLWMFFTYLSLSLGLKPAAKLFRDRSLLNRVDEEASENNVELTMRRSPSCIKRLQEFKAAKYGR